LAYEDTNEVPTLERDGDIAVLNIGDDENRFTPDWLDGMHGCLDEVERMSAPAGLVTVADGKFWSNGLALDWLIANPDRARTYVDTVQRLFSRVLVLGVPTVAAIQGHCYAAAGILALAHDWRVMREDRGFFCLPEVDLPLPFPPGMDALVRAKLPVAAAFESMVTGRRYGGAEALETGIVTQAVGEDRVRSAALELARSQMGKAGPVLGTIKSTMYADVVEKLSVVHRPASASAGPVPS
jgi:enoyl-CoA hydratase/carnithine racemase